MTTFEQAWRDAPPKIGDVQADPRGRWVVVGVRSESGATEVSRVRIGSLAQQVLGENDPRIAAAR